MTTTTGPAPRPPATLPPATLPVGSVPTLPDGPGWVPGEGSAHPVARETLWFDHALGIDHPRPAPWVIDPPTLAGPTESPLPTPAELLAEAGPGSTVPQGLWHTAGATPFPTTSPAALSALDLATLGTAPIRRDPNDPYNDHRAYASPRCLFPVRALATSEGQWHLVDPERRRAVATGAPAAAGDELVALSGRYAEIPDYYGWFSGSLVAIETGILVRHLAALASGHGIDLTLRMPSPGWERAPLTTGWRHPEGWSPPVVLGVGTSTPPADVTGAGVPLPAPGHHDPDPVVDAPVTYRSHAFTSAVHPVPSGIPAGDGADGSTWSDVLWRRSAGRMPRGLWGFRVAEQQLTTSDLGALAAWASVPAPRPWPTDAMTLRAVVRDVDGWEPGIYRLDPTDGSLSAESGVPADSLDRVASSYLYESSPMSRNDIGLAPLVWVLTAKPREIVRELGPAGWTALHQASGWVTQGLCLGAAGRHLLARPVRAFDERVLADALDLDADEMPCLGVVVGHHRPHGGLQIDLRS